MWYKGFFLLGSVKTKQTSRNSLGVFYLAILLMEIYPKEIMVCTQRCVYKMFHSSLYKRRKWKQPKCLTLRDRPRDSLVAQWLRVHLPVQGMLVQSLVGKEDAKCCRAAKPAHPNWREACLAQWRSCLLATETSHGQKTRT